MAVTSGAATASMSHRRRYARLAITMVAEPTMADARTPPRIEMATKSATEIDVRPRATEMARAERALLRPPEAPQAASAARWHGHNGTLMGLIASSDVRVRDGLGRARAQVCAASCEAASTAGLSPPPSPASARARTRGPRRV